LWPNEKVNFKMKTKKTFKEILGDLPKLKKVKTNDKLPVFFDIAWDIKDGRDLISALVLNRADDSREIYRDLAKNGFDAKKIEEGIKNNKQSILRDLGSGAFYQKEYDLS